MGTWSPPAPTQMGYVTSGGWTSGNMTTFGNGSALGTARWASVPIPKGASITAATLAHSFVSPFQGWAPLLVDDLADLSTYTLSTLPPRGTTVAGTSSSTDVKTLVQTLVDRSGWASGNAFGIAHVHTDSSNYTETVTTLDVTWVDPWDAGADQTVDPFTTVTLTGTPSGGTWSQVSGESVTLGGSGAVRTFTAPAKMTQHQMVFQYGTDQMTVTVEPAMHAIVGAGGTLIPTNMVVL